MTITEFMTRFPSDKACEEFLFQNLMKDGKRCSHCGHSDVTKLNRLDRKHIYYKCKGCRKMFTALTNTVFHGSKLGLQKWFLCIYYMTISSKGISSVQLSKQVGVTQKTSWLVLTKLRYFIEDNLGEFIFPVEVDETYIGGLEKNKHRSKRKKGSQGGANKMVVQGIIQRGSAGNIVIAQHVDNTKSETLKKYIYDNVKIKTEVFTDDYMGYRHLKWGYKHSYVKHSKGEYVRGRYHTNTIESFWSLFKRGYVGVYHYMSKKYLQKYINEFTFRNDNKLNPFNSLVEHGRRFRTKTYAELI